MSPGGGYAMTAKEPQQPDETAREGKLFPVQDPPADRIEQLTLQAENHREAAADLLRAAGRAEARIRLLRAYRYAIDAFHGEPQALDLVDRLIEDWAGDGEQLATVVRGVLRAAGNA